MQAGSAVADLRTGNQRRTFAESGGRGRATGALRDVLVDLAVLVGTGTEALHGGDDHARVELVDALPGQPHAVERAGRKVLHQHVARFHQRFQYAHTLRVLGVDGDRALVVIEHGEVERVGALHIDQLAARDITHARTLDLDHVGAEPCQQLRAGRARLDMRKIENAHAGERLAVLAVWLVADLWQAIAAALFCAHEFHDLTDRFLGCGPRLGSRLFIFLLCHFPSPPRLNCDQNCGQLQGDPRPFISSSARSVD